SFALLLAIRTLVSSGAPFRNVKKLQKLAFSRSGMYSAMCSLHWLWAAGSQCSQFLQQCRSTPQCVQASARWSFTSKTSSFLHLWQKCRFSSTLGTQPITVLRSAQPLAPLDVAHHALVLDLPGARALLHMLELGADLCLHGLVELEILAKDR